MFNFLNQPLVYLFTNHFVLAGSKQSACEEQKEVLIHSGIDSINNYISLT